MSQPHRAVLHCRQGRLQQACTSHLTCFALSLHDTRHTHQVKHRILRISRMQVCIEHQHWANAQLMSCAIHAFAHARLAGMSRELVPGECTQLCSGQNCQAWAQETMPFGNSMKGEKALAHHRALAVTTRLWYQQLKHGLQVRAMNPRSLTSS